MLSVSMTSERALLVSNPMSIFLRLRWFCSFFVSNLASFVKVLHDSTISGLMQRDMMFRMRASSSLARKGSNGSGDWNFVKNGLSCWATNAKNLSLQTTNLSRQPSLTARNVTVFGTWLGGFLSTALTYTVMFGNSCRALSATTKSSTHRVAQKCKGKTELPVIRMYSDLLPGESWNKLNIPRRNGATSQSAACTPVCRAP